jgi:hypothetical protein
VRFSCRYSEVFGDFLGYLANLDIEVEEEVDG